MTSNYSEEIFSSLSSIAQSLARPNEGYCQIIFEDTAQSYQYAIIKFSPPHFAAYQKHPPIFHALLIKPYDLPTELYIIPSPTDNTINPNAYAIRHGINLIDLHKQRNTSTPPNNPVQN